MKYLLRSGVVKAPYWLVAIVAGLFIIPVTLCQLIGWPLEGMSYASYMTNGLLSAIMALILCAVIVWLSITRLPTISRRGMRILFIVLAVFSIITEVIVAHALLSNGHGWDVGTVDVIARHYGGNGEALSGFDSIYLARNDNNVPITLLLATIYRGLSYFFGEHYTLYSQIINSTAILMSVFLTVYIAGRLYGKRAALIAFMLGYLLIILSPYTPITYTDTIAMFFVVLTVFCALKISSAKLKGRYFWAFSIGLVLAIGYLMKPTVIFIGLALVFALAITYLNKVTIPKLKKHSYIALFGLLGLTLGLTGYHVVRLSLPQFATYTPAQINASKTPLEHYLAMGSFRGLPPYEECMYGSFCMKFAQYMQSGAAEVSTLAKRKEYALELWRSGLKEDFPSGYSSFLVKKTLLIYSDGSFGVWLEGGNNEVITFYNNNNLDVLIRSYMGPLGNNSNIFRVLLHTIWLVILIVISLGTIHSLFNRKIRENFWLNYYRIAIIGVSIFLILFEGRPRYLFLYLPIFILLAVGTLRALNAYSHRLRLTGVK